MAEQGAHLSQLLLQSGRPSIFELVAQEGLNQAIRGALKFFLRVCYNNYPSLFGGAYRWADEIQFLADVVLQSYYLKNHGASFAENFYGLERVTNGGNPLSLKGKIKSLLGLTLPSYILNKIQEYLKGTDNAQTPRKLSFSTVCHVYELLALVNWILYTLGKSSSHTPLLRMLGVKLQHADESSSSSVSLTKIIEMSAFFIQFLEWWFNNQSTQAKSILSLPVPPAPHSKACEKSPKTKSGECPICHQPWKNECALRVSGYVFCYRCIIQYLKENNCCPVTLAPATSNDLIRIFANAT
uniref:Peroxisome assembly protein 12 n=1 Tax=Moina brachiata TaxID=675436 RepID=A0A4Y7NLP5_9CRUS|nr:EOG090X0AIN [Moina brachiata]